MYWYKTDFQLLPRCGLAELKTPGQRGAVPSSRDPPHSSFEHLVNPLDPQEQMAGMHHRKVGTAANALKKMSFMSS